MQWPLWSIVGHVPRNISPACSFFLQCTRQISCTITGSRRYSDHLPQEELELLSIYTFRGDGKLTGKLRKLFNPSTAAGNYSCPNINFLVVRKATIVAQMSRRARKMILLRRGGIQPGSQRQQVKHRHSIAYAPFP